MMEEGGQRRDPEEVPLNTSSDTSANQTDQLKPIEDSNPQASEHSSTQEIELSGPSGHPPQAIKPSNTQEIKLSGPPGGPPQAIEHSSFQEIELSGPSGGPPQAIEHSSTQEIELSGPPGGPPQAIEHSSTQEIAPHVSPPHESPPHGSSPDESPPHMGPPQVGPPGMGPPHMGPPGMGPPHDNPPPGSDNSNPPMSPYGNKYTVNCALVASVACLLLGFVMGVMSEAPTQIDKDTRITKRQVEYQAAILHVLSLFGAIMGGWISDRIGRRCTIVLTGIFLSLGSILMSFFSNNALLLLGRAVTQVGVSFAPMIATIYIAEISPASSRGFLTTFPQLSINIGNFLGYGFNCATSKFHPNFGRLAMLIVGPISPFLLIIIGKCIMSESPRWLVMQGHQIDARHILLRISNSAEADSQVNSIAESIFMPVEHNHNVQINMQSTWEGVWRDLLLHPILRHILACAVGIHIFQQGCGIDILVLYSPRIFEKAGITSYNIKLILTLLIHFLKAVSILIPTFCLDNVGRKRLLLISIKGMIFGLILLGISLTVLDNSHTKPGWAVGMCIVSLFICVGFYSMGMGPIPSVYSSEIFPLRLRALGNAISVGLSAVMAIIILFAYEVITLGGVAFLFMAITLLAWMFVHRIMPETRGHTLEEMQQVFGTLNLWRFQVEHAAAQGEA